MKQPLAYIHPGAKIAPSVVIDPFVTIENNVEIGVGYPLLVKASLGFESHGKYEFFNRGISGNRIVDVYARIKNDIINNRGDI